jgi:hypothetical protein
MMKAIQAAFTTDNQVSKISKLNPSKPKVYIREKGPKIYLINFLSSKVQPNSNIEILKISRKPLPLSCEIDQTGYLKDTEEGTYIYDAEGNLFVLTSDELSKAISHRIISL